MFRHVRTPLRKRLRRIIREKKRDERKIRKTGTNFPVDAQKHSKLFPKKYFPFLL